MRTIAHVYQSYSEASRVVQALESAGIPHSDISIVSGDKTIGDTGYNTVGTTAGSGTTAGTGTTGTATGMTSGDPEQGAATGAGTGATLGTVLGGGAGLLAGIGALAIPGLGPIVAAGWLVAALTGAGVGAAAGGLLGSLTGAGISEADAQTYQEGVNQGGTLVTVRVDEGQAAHVEQIMGMSTGAGMGSTGMTADTGMTTGTTGASTMGMMGAGAGTLMGGVPETTASRDMAIGATPAMGTQTTTNTATTARPAMDTASTNTGDTIKVMKEDLAVGKREVETGGVRVTSHVVETPVQEQVTLHEEHVAVERRPVNQPVSGADAFRDQTIEARATAEQAVVAKEARVVEEIGLRKEAEERTETVRDTVRETKVDIEDTAAKARPGMTTTETTTTNTTKRI